MSRSVVPLALTLFMGCVPAEPAAGSLEQAVYNGNPETPGGTPSTSGVVFLYPSWCTGTLLTNDWVLSAAHCMAASSAQMSNAGSSALWAPVDFAVDHPSLDFRLLHLQQAIPVNGMETTFKQGFYPNDTGDGKLASAWLHQLGYGKLNDTDNGGNLRDAWVQATSLFDPYTFVTVPNSAGQTASPGDSGGPIFLEMQMGGAMHRVQLGVAKSGDHNGANFSRAENVRDWALSYIDGRNVDLPQTWFVANAYNPVTSDGYSCTPAGGSQCPGTVTAYQAMWSHPLANNFDNLAQWADPCPGRPYSWQASYSLEQYYDWIEITTLNPSTFAPVTTHLTGTQTSGWVGGFGKIQVRVHTDVSNQSVGLKTFPVQCFGDGEVQFTNPWPNPLPPSTNASYVWSPCPGGETWHFSGDYSFSSGDQGEIGGSGWLSGSGTINRTERGAVYLGINTQAGGASPGFSYVTTTCDMAIQCHGPRCFTTPAWMPSSGVVGQYRDAQVYWDPCNGRPFTYKIRYDMEFNYDFVNLHDWIAGTTRSFTGVSGGGSNGFDGPIAASGPLNIEVKTDYSVSSRGVQDLVATCTDWNLTP
jgi:hypothetical protein